MVRSAFNCPYGNGPHFPGRRCQPPIGVEHTPARADPGSPRGGGPTPRAAATELLREIQLATV
ncbi:hypothetical protein OH768_21375 [Streptomyces sp. NBC_01622]|uniref:hypothetical protein n=1 Tax=Streptomyces sp. NBC_01622 TaxID=2975903 RepID=UPI00386B4236|nr:hypothetical protein OH768_21375 [Streptomyces sp. NBC_01622]